jgi:HTH-type transcriptional regulator, sugar sensing transcriptional regulator
MQIELLKSLGFNDKTANIYLALLRLGPSSVRILAQKCDLNRGVVYDKLKWLQEKDLVNFYKKDSKQLFVAENPNKLHDLVKEKTQELQEYDRRLEKIVPELNSLYNKGGQRPISRYYSKDKIKDILQDILDTCENSEENEYRIYSTAGIREYLYDGFETFSDVRISKSISVKVIAIGKGGQLRGMDERKWLKANNETPTYILIYPGKTAYISLNAQDEPVGVVIENEGVFQTQKIIFDNLWSKL